MEIQWPLVMFTALAGTGGYLFACVCFNEFVGKNKPAVIYAAFTAIVLLGLGGISSATHLTHVERMLNALNRPTSGIFLEAMMIFILIALAAVFIILVYRDSSKVVRKVIAVAGIAIAFGFSYSGGESYVMSSQAMWDTPLFVAACLGAPMCAGFSVWMLMLCVCKKEFELSDLRAIPAFFKGIPAFFKRKKGKRAAAAEEPAAGQEAEPAEAIEAAGPDGEAATAVAAQAPDEGEEPAAEEAAAPAGKLAPLPGSALEFRVASLLVIAGSVYAMAAQIIYGVVIGPAFGEYALFFWLLIIGCGGVVPLACALIVLLRKPEQVLPYAIVSLIGGACGAIGFRVFQWLVGGTLMNLFGIII